MKAVLERLLGTLEEHPCSHISQQFLAELLSELVGCNLSYLFPGDNNEDVRNKNGVIEEINDNSHPLFQR